jgi:hypothetical protein
MGLRLHSSAKYNALDHYHQPVVGAATSGPEQPVVDLAIPTTQDLIHVVLKNDEEKTEFMPSDEQFSALLANDNGRGVIHLLRHWCQTLGRKTITKIAVLQLRKHKHQHNCHSQWHHRSTPAGLGAERGSLAAKQCRDTSGGKADRSISNKSPSAIATRKHFLRSRLRSTTNGLWLYILVLVVG